MVCGIVLSASFLELYAEQYFSFLMHKGVVWGSGLPVLSMKYVKTLSETDLEKLGRLKIFSWLTVAEMKVLERSLKMQNFERNELVFRGSAANPSEAHVLVTGILRITCLNGRDERVTVALIAPGPIPQ